MYALADLDVVALVVGGYDAVADEEVDDDDGGVGLELAVEEGGLDVADAHEGVAADLAVVGAGDDVAGQLHLVGVDEARAEQALLAGPAVDGVGGAEVGEHARGAHARAHELGRQRGLLARFFDDSLERRRAGRDAAGRGGVEHAGAAEEVLRAPRDPEARDDAAVVLGGARAHVGDHVGALQDDAEERRRVTLQRHHRRRYRR